MAISTTVTPISKLRMGIKGETTFGKCLDFDDLEDATAYRQLPVTQADKPTFNIHRESRSLSGRGTIKDATDTVIERKNGTVTCPFDFIATPELLLQHLVLVGQDYTADGSNVYTVEFDGSSNNTSIGGTISGGLPHSVNLAFDTQLAAAGITVPGCVVSDLALSADYGSDGGQLRISGNYFSGFSAEKSAGVFQGASLERTHSGTWVKPDQGVSFNLGSLSTKQLEIDGTADQDLILKSFNLNIANGVNRIGSDSDGNAEGYSFPEYTITGDITFKHDTEVGLTAGINALQSYLDGNVGSLALKFGDGTESTVSEMNILAEVQVPDNPNFDFSEAGVFWTLPFECVQNSSTEALKISLFSDTAIAAM